MWIVVKKTYYEASNGEKRPKRFLKSNESRKIGRDSNNQRM